MSATQVHHLQCQALALMQPDYESYPQPDPQHVSAFVINRIVISTAKPIYTRSTNSMELLPTLPALTGNCFSKTVVMTTEVLVTLLQYLQENTKETASLLLQREFHYISKIDDI